MKDDWIVKKVYGDKKEQGMLFRVLEVIQHPQETWYVIAPVEGGRHRALPATKFINGFEYVPQPV